MKTKISFKNSKRLLEYVNNDVLTDYNKFVAISDNYYNDAVNVNNILEEFTTGTSALKTTMSEMNHINDISTTIEESANGTNFIVLVYLHYILHNYN
jgi:methyl-accepting chemotaxis protein